MLLLLVPAPLEEGEEGALPDDPREETSLRLFALARALLAPVLAEQSKRAGENFIFGFT